MKSLKKLLALMLAAAMVLSFGGIAVAEDDPAEPAEFETEFEAEAAPDADPVEELVEEPVEEPADEQETVDEASDLPEFEFDNGLGDVEVDIPVIPELGGEIEDDTYTEPGEQFGDEPLPELTEGEQATVDALKELEFTADNVRYALMAMGAEETLMDALYYADSDTFGYDFTYYDYISEVSDDELMGALGSIGLDNMADFVDYIIMLPTTSYEIAPISVLESPSGNTATTIRLYIPDNINIYLDSDDISSLKKSGYLDIKASDISGKNDIIFKTNDDTVITGVTLGAEASVSYTTLIYWDGENAFDGEYSSFDDFMDEYSDQIIEYSDLGRAQEEHPDGPKFIQDDGTVKIAISDLTRGIESGWNKNQPVFNFSPRTATSKTNAARFTFQTETKPAGTVDFVEVNEPTYPSRGSANLFALSSSSGRQLTATTFSQFEEDFEQFRNQLKTGDIITVSYDPTYITGVGKGDNAQISVGSNRFTVTLTESDQKIAIVYPQDSNGVNIKELDKDVEGQTFFDNYLSSVNCTVNAGTPHSYGDYDSLNTELKKYPVETTVTLAPQFKNGYSVDRAKSKLDGVEGASSILQDGSVTFELKGYEMETEKDGTIGIDWTGDSPKAKVKEETGSTTSTIEYAITSARATVNLVPVAVAKEGGESTGIRATGDLAGVNLNGCAMALCYVQNPSSSGNWTATINGYLDSVVCSDGDSANPNASSYSNYKGAYPLNRSVNSSAPYAGFIFYPKDKTDFNFTYAVEVEFEVSCNGVQETKKATYNITNEKITMGEVSSTLIILDPEDEENAPIIVLPDEL